MSWQKTYITTQSDLFTVPLEDRWKVYIARELFARKPIQENNERLVSKTALENYKIKIHPIWDDENEQDDPEVIAYQAYIQQFGELEGWMRKTVASKLGQATAELRKQGYQLILKAGFRPLQVQQELFDSVYQELKTKQPNLSANSLRGLTRDYVSDPNQITPPHVSGAAIDVLLTKNGKLVDMGCPINVSDDAAWQSYQPLTEQQEANRRLLRSAMLKVGFAPLGSEWWHYSYGDQIWASYYEQPSAIYGIVDR